jgi:hypothetical protein
MLPALFPLKAFLQPLAQNPWTYLVFGLVGFGFGFVLEISGFGNSKKLAAQFYFKDLTVLKVMFGAIITAMVLIFLSSAIGILDFNLVYVPETHLWPGLLGGVIMGVGFIVGGFCPGTALVSASTFKVDGIVFSLGAAVGVWAFGETVQPVWNWWNNSGYYGRLTLMDVFHLPTGVLGGRETGSQVWQEGPQQGAKTTVAGCGGADPGGIDCNRARSTDHRPEMGAGGSRENALARSAGGADPSRRTACQPGE